MSDFTAGWNRFPVDGGLLLVAPDPRRGVVRIHTGVPLRPVKQLLAEMIARGPPTSPHLPPRALVTDEGEHGAIFELVARPPGAPEIRRTIVFIVGDHEMVVLDGRAVDPETFDLAAKLEAMAAAFTLGLGSDRWRRFYYVAPPGWHRRAGFRADVFVPPDHPRNSARITVHFARPLEPKVPATGHARLFEQVGAEFGKGAPLERQPLTLPSGLTGASVTHEGIVEGEPRRVANVALQHARTLHLLSLDTGTEASAQNFAVFRSLVMSARPLPTPRQKAEAFAPWTD
jgi:hypothetical protein